MDITHVGYSDESNWNQGRFRSICLISGPVTYMDQLAAEMMPLVGSKEFKWQALRTADERRRAERLLEMLLHHVGRVRVDVITWDIEDSRHKVVGRDDSKNLQRMYYHLLRNVLLERWPPNAIWRLHPDQQSVIDWLSLTRFIERAGKRQSQSSQVRLFRTAMPWNITSIEPVESCAAPIIQLSDLVAGLAAFSWEQRGAFETWRRQSRGQLALLDELEQQRQSNSQRERFHVLHWIASRVQGMGVSIGGAHVSGLRTWNPARPLNFWYYTPQSEKDKAPRRQD